MADVFDVVDRELAEDRQRDLLQRFAPWLIGAAVLIVLGVWVLTASGEQRDQGEWAQSEAYLAAIELVQRADTLRNDARDLALAGDTAQLAALVSQAATLEDQARPLLADIAENGSEIYRLAARHRLAELTIQGGVSDVGVLTDLGNILGAAAADIADPLYAEGAQLKAIYARIDQISFAEADSQLYALTSSDRSPYRFLARELLAAKALQDGQYELAFTLFGALAREPEIPASLRARAGVGASLAASLTAPMTARLPATPVQTPPSPAPASASPTPSALNEAPSATDANDPLDGEGEETP